MLIRNLAFVLLCAISSRLAQGQQPAPTPSIVYALRNPDSIKDYKTNPHIVHEMVNRLVMAVTGESDVAKAWGSLVSPSDRVGICEKRHLPSVADKLKITPHQFSDDRSRLRCFRVISVVRRDPLYLVTICR